MYCPKCGQQQISGEVRFCSRCGFQLGIIAELMPTNGVLENFRSLQSAGNPSIYRQIVSSFGAKLIFFSIVSLPFGVLLGIPFDTPVFLLISAFLFFIGFVQILYKQIFGKTAPSTNSLKESPKFGSTEAPFRLPDVQSEPMPILEIRNRNTNEIMMPPSVTEHTTKQLDREAEISDTSKINRN